MKVYGVLILLIATAATAATKYSIRNLGTFGGTEGQATGINNSGEVSGSATLPGDLTSHASLYSGGVLNDLGALSGGDLSAGFAVNANGAVAGLSRIITDAAGSYADRAVLFSNNIVLDIGTLGGAEAYAYGINDRNEITGQSYTASRSAHAFLYSDGVMHDLGTLSDINHVPPGTAQSNGADVNNLGQVVGMSTTNSGTQHAFLYSDGAMHDLGTFADGLSGGSSGAFAISDVEQITGFSDSISGYYHAFIYLDGVMHDLGTLGGNRSVGRAINNQGMVVGDAEVAVPNDVPSSHAFVYARGIMQDLNSLIPENSGWLLQNAFGINESGYIVGDGSIGDKTYAFLLTPVPLPTTLPMLASAFCGVGLLRRRAS